MKRILIIEDQTEAKEILINEYCEGYDQINVAETDIEVLYYANKYEYDTVLISGNINSIDTKWIIQ